MHDLFRCVISSPMIIDQPLWVKQCFRIALMSHILIYPYTQALECGQCSQGWDGWVLGCWGLEFGVLGVGWSGVHILVAIHEFCEIVHVSLWQPELWRPSLSCSRIIADLKSIPRRQKLQRTRASQNTHTTSSHPPHIYTWYTPPFLISFSLVGDEYGPAPSARKWPPTACWGREQVWQR